MPDYRQKSKVAYPLDEVLLLMPAAALAGPETVADFARFGRAKLALLRRLRPFANGTPSHDQLGIILAKLDPVAFQRCFAAWTAALTKTSAEVIAVDGKKGAEEPVPVVSALAARQRMALGQTRVGDKSNEIVVAIPALLDHRRHGLPARNRAKNHRQEDRLPSRAPTPGRPAAGVAAVVAKTRVPNFN